MTASRHLQTAQVSAYRHSASLLDVDADSLSAGAFVWRFRLELSSGRPWFIEGFVGGSLSLLHATRGGTLEGSTSLGEWALCASQSDLAGALALRFGDVALAVRLELRGDPFHVGNGIGCIGDPEYWTTSRAASLELSVPLGRGLSLRASVGARESGAYWDRVVDGEISRGGVEGTRLTASVALEVPLA